MNFPLISEYLEAIKSSEDNFEELSYLRPVLGSDGLPIMSVGGFSVVFKMKDGQSGKLYAVKCFTKEQEGRAEAFREIAKELKDISSTYLVSVQYLEKELFVDTNQTTETEFPILLMDWVEGKTLDKYLRENLDDKYALEMLAYRFNQLAQWLIPQPFAHGDLKPDNILVRDDGTLVLVDYDGMYVPVMKDQKAREFGSPDFRHPLRTENDFDEHIDDFSLLSILLSLLIISRFPKLLSEYGAPDRLLFSQKDYHSIDNHSLFDFLYLENDPSINTLVAIFTALCHKKFTFTVPKLKKPCVNNIVELYFLRHTNQLSKAPEIINENTSSITIEKLIDALEDLDNLMQANGIDYVLTGTLGLYIHGFTPTNYLPHDIDILVFNNTPKFSFLSTEDILETLEHYSGGKTHVYADSGETRMYIFYVGECKVEINAFFKRDETPCDYRIVHVRDLEIKVRNSISIFREKYKLHRLKDFEFNKDIQNRLNQFLSQGSNVNIKSNNNPTDNSDELPF